MPARRELVRSSPSKTPALHSSARPSSPESKPPQSRSGASDSTTAARSIKSVLPAEVSRSGLDRKLHVAAVDLELLREAQAEPRVLELVALVEGRVDVELEHQLAPLALEADPQAPPLEVVGPQRLVAAVPHLPVLERAKVGLGIAGERHLEPGRLVADGERLDLPPFGRLRGRRTRVASRAACPGPPSNQPATAKAARRARAASRAGLGHAASTSRAPGILKRPCRSSAIQSVPWGSKARPSWRPPGSAQVPVMVPAGDTSSSRSSLSAITTRRPSGSLQTTAVRSSYGLSA